MGNINRTPTLVTLEVTNSNASATPLQGFKTAFGGGRSSGFGADAQLVERRAKRRWSVQSPWKTLMLDDFGLRIPVSLFQVSILERKTQTQDDDSKPIRCFSGTTLVEGTGTSCYPWGNSAKESFQTSGSLGISRVSKGWPFKAQSARTCPAGIPGHASLAWRMAGIARSDLRESGEDEEIRAKVPPEACEDLKTPSLFIFVQDAQRPF